MALTATTVWEIRQDGDDNNGGGYDADYLGTDYSLQSSAQLSLSDGTTNDTDSATLTSTAGGFTSAMIGNVAHIYGGTNTKDGWYLITGVTNTNTVTLDRAPDDGVGGISGATVKVGGALGSIGGLGAVWSDAAQGIARMIAYIKYSASDYVLTNTTANTAGGPLDIHTTSLSAKECYVCGYDSNRNLQNTDANRPRIDCGSQAPTFVIKVTSSTVFIAPLINVVVDCNSQNSVGVQGHDARFARAVRCAVYDSGGTGFHSVATIQCLSAGNVTGFSGGSHAFSVAIDNSGTGFSAGWSSSLSFCVSTRNDIGFAYSLSSLCMNCVAHNNTGNGFNVDYASMTINCIATDNGGYSFDGRNITLHTCADDGARRTNRVGIDLNPITLTGDPFVNADAATPDFSLITSGAGLQCRAAGLDPVGQDGALDIGAVQHADPEGGTTQRIYIGAVNIIG